VIRVERLAEPEVLAEKKAEWLAAYVAKLASKPRARPESKQYAHKSIVETLTTMSHGKCFYCEAPGARTVDHHIEVVEHPDLAFTWDNLYLACDYCQNKEPNRSIPVVACVDPCDRAADPADHLEFKAEIISYRTERGSQTIKKYRLKRPLLDLARARELRRFLEEAVAIAKPWPSMTAAEQERLLSFAREDAPFSLMFRSYLERVMRP
jgi:hypothetical protein